MLIAYALDRAQTWMTRSHAVTNGLTFLTSDRSRVGLALLNLSTEHQMAIHTLANHQLFGSTITLFRPQLETCVRGIWYLRCATDSQVADFIGGAEPPRIDKLIADIESTPDYGSGILAKLKGGTWKRLCDYTHGGIMQVKGRTNRDEISNNLDPKFVGAVIDASVLLACLAASTLVLQTDKPDRAKDLADLYGELFPKTA
jgi:hypothetical protein